MHITQLRSLKQKTGIHKKGANVLEDLTFNHNKSKCQPSKSNLERDIIVLSKDKVQF